MTVLESLKSLGSASFGTDLQSPSKYDTDLADTKTFESGSVDSSYASTEPSIEASHASTFASDDSIGSVEEYPLFNRFVDGLCCCVDVVEDSSICASSESHREKHSLLCQTKYSTKLHIRNETGKERYLNKFTATRGINMPKDKTKGQQDDNDTKGGPTKRIRSIRKPTKKKSSKNRNGTEAKCSKQDRRRKREKNAKESSGIRLPPLGIFTDSTSPHGEDSTETPITKPGVSYTYNSATTPHTTNTGLAKPPSRDPQSPEPETPKAPSATNSLRSSAKSARAAASSPAKSVWERVISPPTSHTNLVGKSPAIGTRVKSPPASPTKSFGKSPSASPTKSFGKSPPASPTKSFGKSPSASPSKSSGKSPSASPSKSSRKSPSVSTTKSFGKSPSASPSKSSGKSPSASPSKSSRKSPSVSPTKSFGKSPSVASVASLRVKSPLVSPANSVSDSPPGTPKAGKTPWDITPDSSPSTGIKVKC